MQNGNETRVQTGNEARVQTGNEAMRAQGYDSSVLLPKQLTVGLVGEDSSAECNMPLQHSSEALL